MGKGQREAVLLPRANQKMLRNDRQLAEGLNATRRRGVLDTGKVTYKREGEERGSCLQKSLRLPALWSVRHICKARARGNHVLSHLRQTFEPMYITAEVIQNPLDYTLPAMCIQETAEAFSPLTRLHASSSALSRSSSPPPRPPLLDINIQNPAFPMIPRHPPPHIQQHRILNPHRQTPAYKTPPPPRLQEPRRPPLAPNLPTRRDPAAKPGHRGRTGRRGDPS
jgi:hypothetical protein